MKVLKALYWTLLILFMSLGASARNKCLFSLQVYSQINYGLLWGSDYHSVSLQKESDLEVRIVKGSALSRGGDGAKMLNRYLNQDLLQHYRKELGLPPELLSSIQSASEKYNQHLTLVVVGKKQPNGEFVIYGGTGLYWSNIGVEGLPLAKELQDLKAEVNLPSDLKSTFVIEVGRLAMFNRPEITPGFKRELFIRMQGFVKQLLLIEYSHHPKMVLLSFTTQAHERLYRTLGVQMTQLTPVKMSLDTKLRFINSVNIDSLPE